jgi:hypothetical protein
MPSLSSVRSESEQDSRKVERFSVSSQGIIITMKDLMYAAIVLAVLGYLYYQCKNSSSSD